MCVLVDIILIAGFGYFALQQKTSLKKANQQTADVQKTLQAKEKELADRKVITGEVNLDKSKFQAVFMKSGQVYFGKITQLSENQLTLEDIYYLRTNGSKPIGTDVNNPSGDDISLVKLGSELHGPQDKMFIERKEVQFWENLKDDGQVAKAIAEYKKSNQKAN